MVEYTKCSENNFCKLLSERLQSSKIQAKGFLKYNLISLETGEYAGSTVIYSTGRKDRGIALNFCPFCGYSFCELHKKNMVVMDRQKEGNV